MKRRKDNKAAQEKPERHVHHPDRRPSNPPRTDKKTISERENEQLFISPVVDPNKP